MQAKIDTLTMKNGSEEYMVYPRTLIKCITNENGDDLDTTLKGYIAENVEPILEEKIGETYVKNETFTSTTNDLQANIDNKVSNTTTINDKTLDANIVLTAEDVGADVSGAAAEALESANSYTDQKIAALINDAPETLDTLKEVADAIDAHQDVTDALNAAIGTKANASDLTSHTGDTTAHITAAERTAWNAKANGTHTHTKSQITDFPTSMTPTAHKHTKSDISDFPTSMPASDVYAWAKASAKPSYTKAEVGLGNVDNTADSAKSVKYATSAGSASGATYANQLQAFTADNFTGGDHFIKAIRNTDGWNMHLYTCYNNGTRQADAVGVNYANLAGSATNATNATNATYSTTSHGMRSYSASGTSHGTDWILNVQHNRKGNSLFDLYCGNGSIGVQVDRAVTAGSADSATSAGTCTGNSATATTASYAHYAANNAVGTYSTKNIAGGTTDLVAGSTGLTTGHIYVYYE